MREALAKCANRVAYIVSDARDAANVVELRAAPPVTQRPDGKKKGRDVTAVAQ